VDEDQSWFWTPEWQKGEKEVNRSVQKGQTRTFKNVSAMRKHFEISETAILLRKIGAHDVLKNP